MSRRQIALDWFMTFDQFIAVVQDCRRRMPPAQARPVITWVGDDIVDWPPGIPVSVDAVLAIAAEREPVPAPGAAPPGTPIEGGSTIMTPLSSPEQPPSTSKPARRRTPRGTERARKLLRQQLASGPKSGEQIEAAAEAADISERSLIAAADALGVRTQRGQWWLPESM